MTNDDRTRYNCRVSAFPGGLAVRSLVAVVKFVICYGSENTYNVPPLVVTLGKSFMALTNPSAAVGSRVSRSPATTAPDHPPTPDRMATYCLPSGPRNVVGWPIIPDPVLNC